jgi:hypothetical protein
VELKLEGTKVLQDYIYIYIYLKLKSWAELKCEAELKFEFGGSGCAHRWPLRMEAELKFCPELKSEIRSDRPELKFGSFSFMPTKIKIKPSNHILVSMLMNEIN